MTGKILGSASAEQLRQLADSFERPAGAAPKAEKSGEPGQFHKALGSLGSEIDKGEKLVQRALHGGGRLGAGDLIALQAGIYRYSEAVDLAAKLVDRAGQAVRTTLQSNGG